ncbi:hypothetical protein [Denitrobaculum tricleocarpae]|uniref:Uncharacterized protein n=1 Tax=Denitrobaculum tricleocarpae TaxID=2591009 RepID=A0A545TF17_9PROT|nr:hypothetical protein [Denitrobaculum tricleocarpae]TQV75832.1 hypothetical protein FKG95_23260 [Denitrobaculum tricleocarpae]
MTELKTQAIETRVGLDDAEFLSYTRGENDVLRVEIQAWNGSRITFLFEEVIAVFDHSIGDVTSLHEVMGLSDFLKQALNWCYEAPVPADHPHKHYQFRDLNGTPSLEIVSGSITIEYSGYPQTDADFR